MIVKGTKRLATCIARAANYDFCPSWNSFFYWLKEPIGWVVTAIAFSLLVGVLVGPQGYVLALAFTTLLALGMVWPWLSMRGIHCNLVLPDGRTSENQPLEILFRVKNYWPLPVFGMMVKGDFLQELNAGDDPVAFALKRVAAWSETEFRIPLTPQRRGRLPSGDVVTTNGFPFGLIDISKAVTHSTTAIVWPEREPLSALPISESTRFSLNGALRDQPGNDGESIGVRCYRNGDRLRNIHWAQTVRTQRIMVRERQKITAADATVVLDLTTVSHAGLGTKSSYEWAIRIAASICSHLNDSQALVRVICIGLPAHTQTTTDNQLGLQVVLDFLADLPPMKCQQDQTHSLRQSSTQTEMGQPNFQHGGRLFFIATNRSTQRPSDASELVTPVILDVAGFAKTDSSIPMEETTPTNFANDLEPTGDGIFIAAPNLAAEQLAGSWNRSFEDVG